MLGSGYEFKIVWVEFSNLNELKSKLKLEQYKPKPDLSTPTYHIIKSQLLLTILLKILMGTGL